jgi:hypothetical protein
MHRETIGHAVVAAEHGSKILAQGGLPSVALIGDIKDKNHRDKVRTELLFLDASLLGSIR